MSVIDVPKRLGEELEADLTQDRPPWTWTLRRLAVLPEQARAMRLLSFPAADKRSDSRYGWFVHHYGDTCWELDAMNPNDLRALVQAAIEEYIDWPAWWRAEAVEAAE
jgi:hypothetical protein